MLVRGILGKRTLAAVVVFVMAVTALMPCAIGSDTGVSLVVTRHPPGAPSTDQVHEDWYAPSNGQLYFEVHNSGLASVTIHVIDTTTSSSPFWSQTIRFQGDGSAVVDSDSLNVVGEHWYRVFATPGGPPDQSAELKFMYEAEASASITYTVYDMFQEPWGPWWYIRAGGGWDTERLLTDDAGEVTYLYSAKRNPAGDETDQGLIYAPYRWNVDAVALSSLDVHDPVFMPKMGSSSVAGAEASMDVYFQYLDLDTGDWPDYWVTDWGMNGDWEDGSLWGDSANNDAWVTAGEEYLAWNDGYMLGTHYDVVLNRQAAEEWLGMPQTSDPASWWDANKADYIGDWDAWIEDQGNNVFDIYCGYEWPYVPEGTMMRMNVVGDDVVLEIGHFSQGYEALMTRWLKHADVSMHQPYMEDFTMSVDYTEGMADLNMDAVAQWSLHCVQQNATIPTSDALCAWVWEPIALDYVAAFGGHPSDYTPYYGLQYTSWNCGDVRYGDYAEYEATPVELDLDATMKIVVVLPEGDVVGYRAQAMDPSAILNVWEGDQSDYDAIRYYGAMSPGYLDVDGASNTYDPETRTLTIFGPADFENPRPGDLLYHGAPWLEFNVG